MKATININFTQTFTSNNLKGKSFKVVETVGNRTTLNINGRLTDFYNNEVTILETKNIEIECCSYYRDGSTKTETVESVIVRKDNKVKFDGDCMGSYNFRFQKVKSTSFGDYINVYGERMYFAWNAPKFN